MQTSEENINEIIQYLRSLKLPKDEITYPPELIPQIVKNVVNELYDALKKMHDEIDELQDEINRGDDKIYDMQNEIEGHLDTFLEIQNIINEHENNS